MTGSKKRNCGKDSDWSGEQPRCIRIRCTPLPEPLHASLTCSQTNEYGSECVTECDVSNPVEFTQSSHINCFPKRRMLIILTQ